MGAELSERLSENRSSPGADHSDAVAQSNRLLERALFRARCSILWERLWPALAANAAVLGLFATVSWAGLWLSLPALGRAIGISVFLAMLAIATWPLLRIRWPSTEEALRRLDRASGLMHRPATAIADAMATSPNDQVTLALWQAHVDRALRAARALKAGAPAPRLFDRDPWALRALVLILAVATFFAASGERVKRISTAFDWAGVIAPTNFRVDAWITPPIYTGRPPVILPGIRPGERVAVIAPQSVPAGSILVIRATGDVRLNVEASGGLAAAMDDAAKPPAGTQEHRYAIRESGTVTLRGVPQAPVWTFVAVPDRAPAISLAKDPEPQARGALQLTYKIEDDYGVTAAEARLALKSAPESSSAPQPLYGPPDFALVLPQARTRSGVGQTMKDLTEHPWAGAEVEMTLAARDEAQNEGRSDPHTFKLPERSFVKPLARALIEQRRNLALDAQQKRRVLAALDALALAPETFGMETGVYLGLRAAFWQLNRARSDDNLREVVDRLWSMAVFIEDGNISEAEQALRAAQEALRQALERGASEDEIRKLMDQLRAAVDRFLQALAEQMRRNPDQLARPLDPNARQLSPQDLKNMLDRMEQMARSGSRDAARKLLDELAAMLNNLQMARPGQQQGGDDDEMSAALDQLGDMIRRQQQLRDRTFEQGQDRRRQQGQRGQKGQKGQQGQQGRQDGQGQQGQEDGQGLESLRNQQQALREQLNKLLDELRKRGLGQPGQPGEKEMQQLGRAGDAMGDAEGQLGDDNADGAVDSQGRALEALRRGAQSLAQSMQQQGAGQGPGQPGRMGQSRGQQETDPLGRPLRGRWDDSTLPNTCLNTDDPKCFPARRRAEEILNELRRRFGENFRPQLELDYIERLLRDIR